MTDLLLASMVGVLCLSLLSGYPVAFVLSGVSLLFALLGSWLGAFDISYLSAFPNRIYGIMTNDLLIAVPLFIFMGVTLERAKIAEELLQTMAGLFGHRRAGLGISVMVVGALLAASTGIVGATVVTMGLISLPVMLNARYAPTIATGSICASGTLGQIIPPSIVLILLGDQISNAYQTAQLQLGNFSPDPVSIADLFMGAIIPGITLVIAYMLWLMLYGVFFPTKMPKPEARSEGGYSWKHIVTVLVPPLLLIIIVLGSILAGVATATESASVGAVGALILALSRKKLSLSVLTHIAHYTTRCSCMVFTILIGAAMFSLVFRGFGGDDIVHGFLSDLPGGLYTAIFVIMLLMFFLGFFLDFIEITFVVVPIVAPILLMMGAHPVWLAVLIAINLQTSFLTPPFGFALFYLRGVAPKTVTTAEIYRGIIPFVVIQLSVLALIALVPAIATWLPEMVYGSQFVSENTVQTLPAYDQPDF